MDPRPRSQEYLCKKAWYIFRDVTDESNVEYQKLGESLNIVSNPLIDFKYRNVNNQNRDSIIEELDILITQVERKLLHLIYRETQLYAALMQKADKAFHAIGYDEPISQSTPNLKTERNSPK